MVDSDLTRSIKALKSIPSLPGVAAKVNALINDPKSNSSQIASVMATDPGLTAKILRLVNSPYYAIPGGVGSVSRATAYLGLNTVAQLVLGISVFSMFRVDKLPDFDLRAFWKHSLGVAIGAELLAKTSRLDRADEVFTCGLLHDLGKLVLADIDADSFTTILEHAAVAKVQYSTAETQLGIPAHTQIGKYVADQWELPGIIRSCIACPHDFSQVSPEEKKIVAAVALADQLTALNEIGHNGDGKKLESVSPDLLDTVGIPESGLGSLSEQLHDGLSKAEEFLKLL
jgi:HD-like signal output (HDOD) protein